MSAITRQASERLELELLHWRSADNGGAEPSDSEGSEGDAGAGDKYKRRYEQAHRELQLLRAQLRRQHEDDLEQLVLVKKQLEKKVRIRVLHWCWKNSIPTMIPDRIFFLY